MGRPLPNLVNLIDENHRIFNFSRFKSFNNLTWDSSNVSPSMAFERARISRTTQSYSNELTSESVGYVLTNRSLTYTWRTDEAKDLALD